MVRKANAQFAMARLGDETTYLPPDPPTNSLCYIKKEAAMVAASNNPLTIIC
jgi:hypothetical protein